MDVLPAFPDIVSIDFSFITEPMGVAMYLLGKPVVLYSLLSLSFWLVAYPIMSFVKFVYVKIPGVN